MKFEDFVMPPIEPVETSSVIYIQIVEKDAMSLASHMNRRNFAKNYTKKSSFLFSLFKTFQINNKTSINTRL